MFNTEDLAKRGLSSSMFNVCFTGHRPPMLGGYASNSTHDEVKNFLFRVITHLNKKFTIEEWRTGGALGVDTWARTILGELPLKGEPVLCLPFPSMGTNWPMLGDRVTLERHKKESRVEIVTNGYSNSAYHERDMHMVDNSDLVIAVYIKGDETRRSGTALTVNYAVSRKKPVYCFNPRTLWEGFFDEVA